MPLKSLYDYSDDKDDKNNKGKGDLVEKLNTLQACFVASCVKSRGFTFNIIGMEYPFIHPFINMIGAWMHEQAYNVGEVVGLVLGAPVNYCLDDIMKYSKGNIEQPKEVVSKPSEIVKNMLADMITFHKMSSEIIKMTDEESGGIRVLIETIQGKAKHYGGELRRMSGKI